MTPVTSVVDYYDRHPITEAQVLAALRRSGRDARRLVPEDLYEWDQDHYGGLAAVAALARRAGIGPDARVLDVGAGLGGPARFLAHRLGARVTAVELHAGRSLGCARLSRLVGLAARISVVRADARALPFRPASFTAVVSQEGLLHVADKGGTLAECARVLTPGGRLTFSDWVATARLGDGERQRLAEWMAAVSLESVAGYRARLAAAGFAGIEVEDLSPEWRDIVRRRLARHRSLRADTVARLGQAHHDAYEQLHVFFVGLVESGKLGGARFSGRAAG